MNITRHKRNHVPGWQRWFLYTAISGLILSGGIWMAYYWSLGGEMNESMPLSFMRNLMMIHGIFAYLGAIATGIFLNHHVVTGWRSRQQRGSGSSLLILFVILVGSGLMLYYAGDDDLRRLASLAHQLAGAGLLLSLVIHVGKRLITTGR